MGGFGSGRSWGGGAAETVDEALCLDMNDLVKKNLFRWGISTMKTSLFWRCVRNSEAEPMASISYTLNTQDYDRAWVELDYKCNGNPVKYRVQLDYTNGHYGGKRMWFCCPLAKNGVACNRRVAKLYSPRGSDYFGCRKCFGLVYACQIESPHDWFVTKAWKYNSRLGGRGGLEYTPKPKGMHWKTYYRLHNKMTEAVDVANVYAMRRFGIVPRFGTLSEAANTTKTPSV